VPLVPVTLEGSHRVILPKTLKVHPGVIIRIKIGNPIDLGFYGKGDRHRLMDDVFRIMSRDLEDLRSRRQPGEESEDAVFRWVHGQ
jgi:1-acyl-sn-glycerol-3-phosphate acyltransferase